MFSNLLGQVACERNNCNWQYFELEKISIGQIISYELMTNNCGHRPAVSIAIVKIKEDTIRVLSLCTQENFKIGSEINIFPSKKFSGYSYPKWVVGEPVKKTKGWKKIRNEALKNLPTRFDKVILKTTWGEITTENECDRSLNQKISGNSHQCDWLYFNFEKPIVGEIIKFEKQKEPCQISYKGSVAIVKTKIDTIRIIDYCNENAFKEGQKIEISPLASPSSSVEIPYIEKMENGAILKETNEYDLLVKKTAWGKINQASR